MFIMSLATAFLNVFIKTHYLLNLKSVVLKLKHKNVFQFIIKIIS
jgi:hypothetical protein